MPKTSRTMAVRRALFGLTALLSVLGFYNAGRSYKGYEIPYGGVVNILSKELAFYGWFLVYGLPATLCLTLALYDLSILERFIVAPLRSALRRPVPLVAVLAIAMVPLALLIRHGVLLDQPVSDDELCYELVARTVEQGGVMLKPPLPPVWIVNQFTIAGPHGWYAKYPIGHGVVLALGNLLGSMDWAVPVVGAFSVWMTFLVGKRLLDAQRAALACVLLVLSPQFVFTHATWLSQPTSTLCMLVAMYGVLRVRADGGLRWVLLASAALGFGAVARPMPTTYFVIAAGLSYLLDPPRPVWRGELAARTREIGAASVGPAVGLLLLLATNQIQSGAAFVSGYQQIHGATGFVPPSAPGAMGASFGGALLRQSVWLSAWPIGLFFVLFARMDRARILFWGMIVGEYVYRLVTPKTVVATTGPIYVLEIVPLLCLATVDGMSRAASLLRKLELAHPSRAIAALALSATLAGFTMFLPVNIDNMLQGARVRTEVFDLIESTGAERPLIFANLLVYPAHRRTWAYFPPSPKPDLSDDVLFLRYPAAPNGYEQAENLWRKVFPDRRAFILHVAKEGPALQELPVAPEQRKPLLPPQLPLN